MKILKLKSGLFSLMALMAVTVLMTSCEQTATTFEEEITEMSLQTNETQPSMDDLPAHPDDVLASSKNPKGSSESIDDRRYYCPRVVHWISSSYVSWNSNPQYALWIYHYDANGTYLGYTRMDVPSCGTWTKPYTPPPGTCLSVAFVGYQWLSTETYAAC